MQNLTVTGIDGDALVAVTDTGEEFRIPVDEAVQSRVRQVAATLGTSPKVSPREIQMQIRSGLTAAEVAEATGASLEYVERFEGPVLDERRHILEQAQRVPVKLHTPTDPLGEESQAFGEVIGSRLEGLGADTVRWASWKDESGWLVKVTFRSQSIDHDARWQYDPKRHTLNPTNADAVTLSQAGEITGGLIPRLRAVGVPSAELANHTQPASSDAVIRPVDAPVPPPVSLPAAQHPSLGGDDPTNQTADLLEVLRRRRGEREAASFSAVEEILEKDSPAEETQDTPLRPVSPFVIPQRTEESSGIAGRGLEPEESTDDVDDLAEHAVDEADSGSAVLEIFDDESASELPEPQKTPRRSRATMPSWDEIVFGARDRDE